MHSNHCDRIKQPQSRFRPGTEDRQRGGHVQGKAGSGQDKPERQGGGGHPAAATAEWCHPSSGTSGVPGPGVCAQRKRRAEVELRPDPRPPGSRWSKMVTVKPPKPPATGLTRQPNKASIVQKI